MIAALFVHKNGAYYGIPDVDPWPEDRDARTYPGPHPVVAHPPCNRWSQLARVCAAGYGHKFGADDGCFASALASVRRWGGVLEHPAQSGAWAKYGLPRPSSGGWQRGLCGGWSTHVEQGWYGHLAQKPTWLYAFGVSRLPPLRTGTSPATHVVRKWKNGRPELPKRLRAVTPLEFRDVLLGIARSVEAP